MRGHHLQAGGLAHHQGPDRTQVAGGQAQRPAAVHLFAGGAGEDQIALQTHAGPCQRGAGHRQCGAAAFHVDRTAAVQEVALHDRRVRVVAPLLALHRHGVEVAVEQQRGLVAGTAPARHHVGAARGEAVQLHLQPGLLQPPAEQLGDRSLPSRRVATVDADQPAQQIAQLGAGNGGPGHGAAPAATMRAIAALMWRALCSTITANARRPRSRRAWLGSPHTPLALSWAMVR